MRWTFCSEGIRFEGLSRTHKQILGRRNWRGLVRTELWDLVRTLAEHWRAPAPLLACRVSSDSLPGLPNPFPEPRRHLGLVLAVQGLRRIAQPVGIEVRLSSQRDVILFHPRQHVILFALHL